MNKNLMYFTTNPPFSLTWEDGQTDPAPARTVLDNPALATADRMVCDQCGADVTRASLRIAVNGSHRHLLPTVHGIEQAIGCFSLAPGCTEVGHFTLDFSRPTGGSWQMSLCAACGNHLGWHYETPDGLGFYGLLLDHLAAAPETDGEEDV